METDIGTLLGLQAGIGVSSRGRLLLDSPNAKGQQPIPTDVLPNWPSRVGMVTLVPLVVTLIAVVALRRAAVTPGGRCVRGHRALTRYFARENTPGQAVAYLTGPTFIGMLMVSIGIVTT